MNVRKYTHIHRKSITHKGDPAGFSTDLNSWMYYATIYLSTWNNLKFLTVINRPSLNSWLTIFFLLICEKYCFKSHIIQQYKTKRTFLTSSPDHDNTNIVLFWSRFILTIICNTLNFKHLVCEINQHFLLKPSDKVIMRWRVKKVLIMKTWDSFLTFAISRHCHELNLLGGLFSLSALQGNLVPIVLLRSWLNASGQFLSNNRFGQFNGN